MARTKQTARASTGTRAPRKQIGGKTTTFHSNVFPRRSVMKKSRGNQKPQTIIIDERTATKSFLHKAVQVIFRNLEKWNDPFSFCYKERKRLSIQKTFGIPSKKYKEINRILFHKKTFSYFTSAVQKLYNPRFKSFTISSSASSTHAATAALLF
jgi:hypothetical protein